jgi:hypothetical protein
MAAHDQFDGDVITHFAPDAGKNLEWKDFGFDGHRDIGQGAAGERGFNPFFLGFIKIEMRVHVPVPFRLKLGRARPPSQ